MSHWSKSPAARLRDVQWKMKRGISVLGKPRSAGRSLAGKIYLPSDSPTNAPARAGDDNAEAVASTIPNAASPSAEGQLAELPIGNLK